jgi:hypothetical protein
MPRKKHKAEEIVAKLRQVDVLTAQGRPVAEAACMKNAGGDTRGRYPEYCSPLILAAASLFS